MDPEDVKKVAQALIDNHWNLDESGMNCYCECNICYGKVRYTGWDYDPSKIVHELDCAVLVARDLLVER